MEPPALATAPPDSRAWGENASCWRPPQASRRGLAAGHAFGGKKGLFRLVQQRSPAAFPRARLRPARCWRPRGERDGGGGARPVRAGQLRGAAAPPGTAGTGRGLNPAQGLREMNSRMN